MISLDSTSDLVEKIHARLEELGADEKCDRIKTYLANRRVSSLYELDINSLLAVMNTLKSMSDASALGVRPQLPSPGCDRGDCRAALDEKLKRFYPAMKRLKRAKTKLSDAEIRQLDEALFVVLAIANKEQQGQ